jgi:hypothetical protein
MSGPDKMLDEEKQPFWVNCAACGHEWILFYAPIAVEIMAKFAKNPCPMCGEAKHVKIGTKPKPVPPTDAAKPASEGVMEWLASGDTGISSESLAYEYLGTERKGHFGVGHPHDPADLGRCLRLIARIPEVRSCVDRLAAKREGWAKAAKVWDRIAASMEEEVGIDWSKGDRAPKTYELMMAAGL